MEKANRVRGGRARPLPSVGTALKAFHRGRSRSAVIIETAEFSSGRGVFTAGRAYLSLSAAGTAITGYPVNGSHLTYNGFYGTRSDPPAV